MMLRPIFRFIKDKSFLPQDSRYFDYVRTLPKGQYDVHIRKPYVPKSRLEEKFYWVVCVQMWAEHYGITRREAHEDLLLECADRDEEGKTIRTSDSRMTRGMYHSYAVRCREFMAREGCNTPDPGSYDLEYRT